MFLTLKGLVLRITDYNDRDSLLTVLSPNHGKLTIKARGLRRKNSPLIAPCQLLTYSEFTLFEYRGMYTINEAETIEQFSPLRRDLCKLSLGTYFAQAAEVVSQEDQPNPELLSLVLNCLYALSRLPIENALVKAVFELRIACLAGYAPDLSGCQQCGNPLPDRFDLSAGCLECGSCRNPASEGIRMPVTHGMVEAMRYIAHCDGRRLFSFHIDGNTAAQLSGVTEAYLTTQLERSFSTLDFYKSLLVEA